MKKVLITGCSGYIGSHLCKHLHGKYELYGIDFIDNEDSTQYLKYYSWRNIYNINESSLTNIDFDTVIHLAAVVRVNESMDYPTLYYKNNIQGTMNIVKYLKYKNFIFSSTGAAENPISPYARSKLCCEDIVNEYCKYYKANHTIFRFYNVIGSDGFKPTNIDGLFYNLMKARETGEFNLYGKNYNTKDGTPIRDYIHVMEVCHAIEEAIENPSINPIENLGHGVGYTVQEMVDAFKVANHCDFKVNYLRRREGDLESTVLDNPSKYMKNLYTIDEMLKINEDESTTTKQS